MNLRQALGGFIDCECGRRHEVPVREFVYSKGAIDRLPAVLARCLGDKRPSCAVLVADVRTWAACGADAARSLRGVRIEDEVVIVPDKGQSSPVCDEKTCSWLKESLQRRNKDVVVAVGSGVINDLCKWACFELNLPYAVVATAASMNGYAAANVAAKIEGVKVLVEARPPVAVVAEPKVIAEAPAQMTAAGFGDTIAKHLSNTDWLVNHLLLDEYYCRNCAEIVSGLEHLYLDRPEDIAAHKNAAVDGLFEALFWTGIAMTVVGTSAPASGGEHLLSHTLDMMADVRGHEHDLHGRQVGLGAVFAAALYKELLAVETPEIVQVPSGIDGAFWGSGAVANAVAAQYAAKQSDLQRLGRKIARTEKWDDVRAQVEQIVPDPGKIKDWLVRAGAAGNAGDIGCSRERLMDAVMHMHEIRRRCTVVDIAWLCGIMPAAADEIVDDWLM